MNILTRLFNKNIFSQDVLFFDRESRKYYLRINKSGERKYFDVGDRLTIYINDGIEDVPIDVEVVYSNNKSEFPRGYCLVQEGFDKGLWFEDVDKFSI